MREGEREEELSTQRNTTQYNVDQRSLTHLLHLVRRRDDRQLLVDADAPIYTSNAHRLAWRSAVDEKSKRLLWGHPVLLAAHHGTCTRHTREGRERTGGFCFFRNV